MDRRQRYRRSAYSSGMASGHTTMKPTARAMLGWCAAEEHSMSSDAVRKDLVSRLRSSKPKLWHWKARKSERVTDGSTQNEMKTAASRLRSAALLTEPLRAALRAASVSATASISTNGHNPLKARRVVSPPTHFQSGKMKLPISKPSGVSTDTQLLSPLGNVLCPQGNAHRRVSSRPATFRGSKALGHTSRRRSRALATLGQRREPA